MVLIVKYNNSSFDVQGVQMCEGFSNLDGDVIPDRPRNAAFAIMDERIQVASIDELIHEVGCSFSITTAQEYK